MKRIIELSENDYMVLKEGVQNHLALADTIIEHSVIYEEIPLGEWIPVSERLPDKNMKCLVSLDCGNVIFDIYSTRWGFVNYIGSVVAWQPLPEPYQKGGAENEIR